MILLLDLGNVSLNVSVYQNRKELFNYRTYSDKTRSEEEYEEGLSRFLSYNHLSKGDIDGAMLCSVVPSLTKRVEQAVNNLISKKCMVLTRSLKTGLAIRMDNPSEVGSDLLSESLGALNNYQKDCLIIDMSPVLSFVIVTENKEFIGGSLFPGLRSSAAMMFNSNAQLMDIDLEKPRRLIGKSTKECMNSGIVSGYFHLIDSYAKSMEKEFGKPLVRIITGPDASIIRPLLTADYIIDQNLVFDGLYDIYMKNQ